jgi:poly(A) polymerase
MDLDGNILDPLGTGLRDIEARILRTPRDPRATFDDDPLRMLRAIRFAAQLGFELDPSLLPAMRDLRERARPPVLSVERTNDELRKMLLSERPELALNLLRDSGLLEVLLPEVQAMVGLEQRGYHTHDVFGHTALAVQKSPPGLTQRLAALMHDVGKPLTAAGDGTFTGHDLKGAPIAEDALKRLRFPHSEAERVARLVKLHMRPVYYDSTWTDAAVRRLARDAGELLWPLVDLARADIAASAYPHPEKIDELAARLRDALARQPGRVRPKVSGEDIMRVLGMKAGPEVGKIKARLEELVLEGEIEPTREAVLEFLEAHRAEFSVPGKH